MKYVFDWDPAEEQSNRSRHGVSFRQTMSVFSDAHAVTLYDASHDDQEDRWVTIGQTACCLFWSIHTTQSAPGRR